MLQTTKILLILACVVRMLGCVQPAIAQTCTGPQCQQKAIKSQPANNTKPAASSTGKKEGWANVPGGTVWLEPGIHAYEHDTGLVRDLRTGQKFAPITPQSIAQPQHYAVQPYTVQPYAQPLAYRQPVTPAPQPVVPRTPQPPVVVQPPVLVQPYYVNPYYMPLQRSPIDVGPYGTNCGSCGAISTRGSTISQQWRHVQ